MSCGGELKKPCQELLPAGLLCFQTSISNLQERENVIFPFRKTVTFSTRCPQ